MSQRRQVLPVKFIEPLQKPDSDIPRFRKRELLADANARAAIERQVFPARPSIEPAFGLPFIGILAPKVLAMMHDVYLFRNLVKRM